MIGSKLIYIYDLFSPLDTIVKINLQHKQIPYFIFVISFFACCIYIRSDVRGRVHLDDNNTCTDISTEKMIKFKTKNLIEFYLIKRKNQNPPHYLYLVIVYINSFKSLKFLLHVSSNHHHHSQKIGGISFFIL